VARLAALSAFGHFLHDDEDKEDLLLSKTLLTLADGSELKKTLYDMSHRN
jgi:hypothetical protein